MNAPDCPLSRCTCSRTEGRFHLCFRHVMRHAYDLTLREDRLTELAQIPERLGLELPVWCKGFGERVRTEQGW